MNSKEIQRHHLFDDDGQFSLNKKRNGVPEECISNGAIEIESRLLPSHSNNKQTSKRSYDLIDKNDEDFLPNKRLSIDNSKNHVIEAISHSNKKEIKQVNQKIASQRYRYSLKQKSKQVEEDLKAEEEKQEKLKKIFIELQNALDSLSSCIVKQTKISDTNSLLSVLKNNNLTHTAKKIEEIQDVKLDEKKQTKPQISKHMIETNIFPKSVTINKTPVKQPVFYENDDCQINRFQELFVNDNSVNQRTENCSISDLIENIVEMDQSQIDFGLLFSENF